MKNLVLPYAYAFLFCLETKLRVLVPALKEALFLTHTHTANRSCKKKCKAFSHQQPEIVLAPSMK